MKLFELAHIFTGVLAVAIGGSAIAWEGVDAGRDTAPGWYGAPDRYDVQSGSEGARGDWRRTGERATGYADRLDDSTQYGSRGRGGGDGWRSGRRTDGDYRYPGERVGTANRGAERRYGLVPEYGRDYGSDYGPDYGSDYGADYGSGYGADYGSDHGPGFGVDHGRWGGGEMSGYRFREDKALESQAYGRDLPGYRFRPLTDKERERSAGDAPWPRENAYDDLYPDGRPTLPYGEDENIFGYRPNEAPGSFFDRYYRGTQ